MVLVVEMPALISLVPRMGLGMLGFSYMRVAAATGMPRIRAPAQRAAVMRGRGRSLMCDGDDILDCILEVEIWVDG